MKGCSKQEIKLSNEVIKEKEKKILYIKFTDARTIIISTKIIVWDCKALCFGNLVKEIHSLS